MALFRPLITTQRERSNAVNNNIVLTRKRYLINKNLPQLCLFNYRYVLINQCCMFCFVDKSRYIYHCKSFNATRGDFCSKKLDVMEMIALGYFMQRTVYGCFGFQDVVTMSRDILRNSNKFSYRKC